jgi:hypothetical protein
VDVGASCVAAAVELVVADANPTTVGCWLGMRVRVEEGRAFGAEVGGPAVPPCASERERLPITSSRETMAYTIPLAI